MELEVINWAEVGIMSARLTLETELEFWHADGACAAEALGHATSTAGVHSP